MKLDKILLIKREKPPLKDLWSFPGGRLEESDKHFTDAMIREAYEETGYKIKLLENQLYNIEYSINKEYMILTGIGIITDSQVETLGRTDPDLKIVQNLFQLSNPKEKDYLFSLQDAECIPHLLNIVKKFRAVYSKDASP